MLDENFKNKTSDEQRDELDILESVPRDDDEYIDKKIEWMRRKDDDEGPYHK